MNPVRGENSKGIGVKETLSISGSRLVPDWDVKLRTELVCCSPVVNINVAVLFSKSRFVKLGAGENPKFVGKPPLLLRPKNWAFPAPAKLTLTKGLLPRLPDKSKNTVTVFKAFGIKLVIIVEIPPWSPCLFNWTVLLRTPLLANLFLPWYWTPPVSDVPWFPARTVHLGMVVLLPTVSPVRPLPLPLTSGLPPAIPRSNA